MIKLNGNDVVLLNTKAYFNRTFEIYLTESSMCDICGKVGRVVCTDGSDGEYGGPSMCTECLRQLSEKLQTFDFNKSGINQRD